MSVKDPKEHLKTYERFCAPRFKKIEDDLGIVDGKVDNIDKVVNDGLKEKVDDLKLQCRWLIRLLISLLMLLIASTVTLYVSNATKYFELEKQLTEHDRGQISN